MKSSSFLAALLALVLVTASCATVDGSNTSDDVSEDTSDDVSDGPAEEVLEDEPVGDELDGDEETTDGGEGDDPGSEDLPDLPKDMSDFPDENRPRANEWSPLLCDPSGPTRAEQISDIVDVADSPEIESVFDGDTPPRQFTLRVTYRNDLDQMFSVYSSSDDLDSAAQLFTDNLLCVESRPVSEELSNEQFDDEQDVNLLDDGDLELAITEEFAAADDEDSSRETIDSLAHLPTDPRPEGFDGADGSVRLVVIVAEFCDAELPPDLTPDFCGNDDLAGEEVATHVFIDPTVGRGSYDYYSVKTATSVYATVKSTRSNHKVFAALRKKGSWTKVSYARVSYGYSRTIRANTASTGPVWFSVYGYSSNPSTAVYGVSGTWRSESYSK